MDDLRLLDDLVRADPLPTRTELVRSRTDLLEAMATTAAPPRRRTWFAGLALAGTAAAAAAVLAVTVLGSPPAPSPPPPVADAPPSVGATTDVPVRAAFRLAVDSPESAQATARRLGEELDAALRKTAPGARWIAVPHLYGTASPVIKGWDGQKGEAAGQLFNGGGAVEMGDRQGSLSLLVQGGTGLLTCAPDQPGCTVSTGPGGVKLVLLTITAPGKPTTGDPYVQLQARVAVPDGRVLVIVHSNDTGPDGTPKTGWRAPLTMDQVTTVATDIAARIKA